MRKRIFPLFLLLLFAASCTYKKWDDIKPESEAALVCDTTRVISYAGDIAPFMTATCGSADVNCHSSSSSSLIPLDVYVGVQYYGQTGQMMDCINHSGSASPMPKNSAKLGPCEIALIQKWVNEGEPNN